MKEGRASKTAESVAACRAAESLKPEPDRVCYDPLAMYFLGTVYGALGRSRLLTKIALGYSERLSPGGIGCIVGRTRYID